MANCLYKKVKNLSMRINNEIPFLYNKLISLNKDCEELYELLRYSDLSCSDKEYDRLDQGFCWNIEEFNGFNKIENLINLLEILRKSTG